MIVKSDMYMLPLFVNVLSQVIYHLSRFWGHLPHFPGRRVRLLRRAIVNCEWFRGQTTETDLTTEISRQGSRVRRQVVVEPIRVARKKAFKTRLPFIMHFL